MNIKKVSKDLGHNWWNQTKDNAINYLNIAIINGLVIAGAHVVSGYLQARAIDHAVESLMVPIDAVHQKVDSVLTDVAEITENAKGITSKIKATGLPTLTPTAVKKAVGTAQQGKVLPKIQDIKCYLKNQSPEKKNRRNCQP